MIDVGSLQVLVTNMITNGLMKSGDQLTFIRQEVPNSVGGEETNVPDASNSRYGTATDQVRQLS